MHQIQIIFESMTLKNITRRKPSLIYLCLLLIASPLQSQHNEYKVTRYNASDGLADNTIFSIYQDYQGIIWLGTGDGLHRYDGVEFKAYQHNPNDSTSFPNKNVYGLFEDSQHNFWIGSDSYLSRYDRRNDQFINYPFFPEKKYRKPVTSISQDNQGHLWICAPNVGIFRFDQESGVFQPMIESIEGMSAPDDGMMTDPDGDGIFEKQLKLNPIHQPDTLLYTYSLKTSDRNHHKEHTPDESGRPRLRELVLNKNNIITDIDIFNEFNSPPLSSTEPPEESIDQILITFRLDLIKSGITLKENESVHVRANTYPLRFTDISGYPEGLLHIDDEMWLATKRGGLYCINTRSGAVKQYAYQDHNENSISSNFVGKLVEDSDGNLWVGTDRGLNHFNRETERFTQFIHPDANHSRLYGDNVNGLVLNPDGSLWISRLEGFVEHLDPRSKTFSQRFKPTSKSASTLFVDNAGLIWRGSMDEGLFKLDPGISQFPLYAQPAHEPRSSYGKYIQAFEEDDQGNFWIAGELGGLFHVDRSTRTFSHVKIPDLKNTWSVKEYITDLEIDNQSRLWVARLGGLFYYDLNQRTFREFYHNSNDNSSVSSDAMNGIFEDSKGQIWVFNNTLNKYDPMAESFTRYTEFQDNKNWYGGLSASKIREDASGNFWIGTFAMGLIKFDTSNRLLKGFLEHKGQRLSAMHPLIDDANRLWFTRDNEGLFEFDIASETVVRQITEGEGLLHNAIQSIEHDDSGNLWISSHRGLTKFNPDHNTFKHYFEEDGLQNNEFRYLASHKCSTDELMFGGQYGFNVFHPDSIQDHPFIPPIVLTDFMISGKSLKVGDLEGYQTNIVVAEQINLKYDENDFSISFAALDFSLPERNLYSHLLENYDHSWRSPSPDNIAEYTNLDPGTYVFKVKGSNRDGVWNPDPAEVVIVISPPWWRTWWAYVMYVVVSLGILWVLRIYELNRLNLKNRVKLEATKLKEREEVDRLKSNFFTNISHEFRTPLTLIIGPLKKLLDETRDGQLNKSLNIMYRNASRLLKLINQLLDISKLEAHELKLQASEHDIVKFIRGILMSFHSLAEQKGVRIDFQSESEVIDLYFDWDKAENIFSNLLSNAFKFTPAPGKVEVKISKGSQEDQEGVMIQIIDSGIGIPGEDLERIFQRFHQVDNRLAREHEGSGIGLALTKELVDLHHGHISVNSMVDSGTEFVVFLPSGSSHLKPEEISDTAIQDKNESSNVSQEFSQALESRPPDQEDQPLVLVVEDNTDMRLYIHDVLSPSYRIEEAFDGQMGVEQARELLPDLIVSDLMMPRKDGFELCSELKLDEVTSHIPVILLTAKAEREDRLEGLQIGADDYLIKPFDSQELQIRIQNLIHQRQQLRDRFSNSIKVEASEITVTSMDAQFLQKAIDMVEENIENESFSVEQFSADIGLSRRQFYQKIKSITGLTPTEFVLSIRLKRAAVLISEKGGTISEIAYTVGFNNLSYFARAFKKQFGVTPSKYTAA